MDRLECELKERIVVKELYELMSKGKEATYYTTPIFGVDRYDGCIYFMDDGRITDRYIIEVKVRTAHYQTLIYEKGKHNDLKKISNEINAKIIYVNLTPTGCYLFLIKDELLNIKESLTRDSSQCFGGGKKSSETYMLDVSKAKKVDITLDNVDALYLENIKKVNNQHKVEKQMHKDIDSVEDLFRKK